MKLVSISKITRNFSSHRYSIFNAYRDAYRKNFKFGSQIFQRHEKAKQPAKSLICLFISHISKCNKKVIEAVFNASQTRVIKGVVSQKTGILLSASCLLKYDFEANGISDASLESFRNDNQLDGIAKLIDATVKCNVCGKRKVLHNKVPNVEYCECKEGNSVNWNQAYEGWVPFLEQENVLVWRKPHENYPNLYAYKVYGRYDDVSMSAFVETQLNTSYRTSWDNSVLELSVLQNDEKLQEREENSTGSYSAQDLLYWLVKFPRFFADRDYVFKRRYRVDNKRREAVIINLSERDESVYPQVGSNHRVREYWSVMVIRARHHDYHKPGIEYILSYFDNPGTSLPASITNFIASTAFPNFLSRLHTASLALQNRFKGGEMVYSTLPQTMMEKGQEIHHQMMEERMEKRQEENITKILSVSDQLSEVMEALGEVVPHDKLQLIEELEKMISDFLESVDDSSPVMMKIKSTKEKIDSFLVRAKKSKLESIELMQREMKRRSNRYEDTSLTSTLLFELFTVIKEVLQEDLDMRTGKSLSEDDSDPPRPPPVFTPSWGSWFYETFVEKPITAVRSPKKENTQEENEEEELDIDSEFTESHYRLISWPSNKAQNNASSSTQFPEEYYLHNTLNIDRSKLHNRQELKQEKSHKVVHHNESAESWYLKPVTVPYRYFIYLFGFGS